MLPDLNVNDLLIMPRILLHVLTTLVQCSETLRLYLGVCQMCFFPPDPDSKALHPADLDIHKGRRYSI